MSKKLNLISCLHQVKQNASQARTRKERIRWLTLQCIIEGLINTQAATKEAKSKQGV